ncbi:hypothetical protein C8F04DRAFT_1247798 [Mycena alexandri]|uniref:GID complex catalytic subunit 2 n=1 Tax=Mycena alexandri TaxID=1745969 RepID=A0AAD6THJ2_9AGAR|nr:hypothetical protein C8F04DRAFT_1247798 [Mycena alexandri]
MDGPLKELAKLEKLTAGASGKGKASISNSLDALLESLREAKDAIQPGATVSPDLLLQLSQTVDLQKKEVDERQKEVYSSISRLGKALDKKFTASLPSYPEVFTSSTSVTALERTIALHFLRTGQFDTAGMFLQEAGLNIDAELRAQFIDLHRILQALRNQDINPALGWVAKNRAFLRERGSPLEFHLHRSQYIRLLLSTHPPSVMLAISYAKETMAPLFFTENEDEFKRLTCCIMFLPLSKLQTSPYSDLASPSLHFDLEPLFAKEYCASLGMSRQVPLRVVGDIGGGGALARIEKGRKVMRERKSEWSQADELPIEIPLPPENRYHSIFACPVSKEQSNESNPPMMMGCGHVVTKDSLHKLSKPGGRVKCPYCPAESTHGSALRDVSGPYYMSGFRPTRASPPSKLTALTDSLLTSTLSADLSRSSSVSIRELIGLTHEEVDLLDAIIAHAGASATTFPAVFDAYNAVFKERGLDPSADVVYYGKLLKLGTLKGSNWGEKWQMVKVQQGYDDTPRSSQPPARGAPKLGKNAPTRFTRLDPPSTRASRHPELHTLHSHEIESTAISSDDEDAVDVPQYHLHNRPSAMRRPPSPIHSEITSPSLDSQNYPLRAPPARLRTMPPTRPQMWEAETSDATERRTAPSTTPPSYRAAVREPAPAKRQIIVAGPAAKRPSSSSLATARQLVAQAREQKGSVVNEDDAWKKIKMLQDEKDADAFRQDRLVERCWEVWKEGFQWIITTNRQIGEARDVLILRLCIQRWRALTAASRERAARVASTDNQQRLKAAFKMWRNRTKEREQARWRASMRAKMKLIRDKRELKLMTDALTKWRQSHRIRSADRHYAESLVLRYYERWRKGLAHLDRLEGLADQLSRVIDGGALEQFWYRWKHAAQLQIAHKIVTENVGLRIKTEVVDVRDNHVADAYYDTVLKKRMLRSWKSARDIIQTMENNADILHDHRSMRVIYMMMKTRYQQRRLTGIVNTTRLKEAWTVWRTRMRQRKELEDAALAFSLRHNSPLAKTWLRKWYKVHSSHKNSQSYAAFHHSDAVRRRALLLWRIKLRNRHKLMSQARAVDKFLVVRSAWTMLRAKFAERRRLQTLKILELRKARILFYAWFERAHRQRSQRLAEKTIRDGIIKRILSATLTSWTNRTIEVKNRELQAGIDRDAWLLSLAFKKWKAARGRHVAEVSLMESYQFVKREEHLAKFFHRWLSVTRTTRRRRIALHQKESEFKSGLVSDVWEKWRSRFKQRRLQPIEYEVLLKGQENTLRRVFKLWHSKTKSLPAIRFSAERIKRVQARCWNVWLQALPRALQTKTAREVEQKAVLFAQDTCAFHRRPVAQHPSPDRHRRLKAYSPVARPELAPKGHSGPQKPSFGNQPPSSFAIAFLDTRNSRVEPCALDVGYALGHGHDCTTTSRQLCRGRGRAREASARVSPYSSEIQESVRALTHQRAPITCSMPRAAPSSYLFV